jgi:hypothetical protein
VTMVTSGWYEGESYRVNKFCATKIDYDLKLCYEWNGKCVFECVFSKVFKKKINIIVTNDEVTSRLFYTFCLNLHLISFQLNLNSTLFPSSLHCH